MGRSKTTMDQQKFKIVTNFRAVQELGLTELTRLEMLKTTGKLTQSIGINMDEGDKGSGFVISGRNVDAGAWLGGVRWWATWPGQGTRERALRHLLAGAVAYGCVGPCLAGATFPLGLVASESVHTDNIWIKWWFEIGCDVTALRLRCRARIKWLFQARSDGMQPPIGSVAYSFWLLS